MGLVKGFVLFPLALVAVVLLSVLWVIQSAVYLAFGMGKPDA